MMLKILTKLKFISMDFNRIWGNNEYGMYETTYTFLGIKINRTLSFY